MVTEWTTAKYKLTVVLSGVSHDNNRKKNLSHVGEFILTLKKEVEFSIVSLWHVYVIICILIILQYLTYNRTM